MNNQTQSRISDARLAEKRRHAEVAEAAHAKCGWKPQAEVWREDVSLLRELTALRASHKRLVEALEGILDEYDSQKSQFGRDSIWKKYEDLTVVDEAVAALAEARKLEGK